MCFDDVTNEVPVAIYPTIVHLQSEQPISGGLEAGSTFVVHSACIQIHGDEYVVGNHMLTLLKRKVHGFHGETNKREIML